MIFTLIAQATIPSTLPSDLSQMGHTLWQTPIRAWLLLLASIFGALVLGRLLAGILRQFARIGREKHREIRAIVLDSMASPASLAVLAIGLRVGGAGIRFTEYVSDLYIRSVSFLLVISVGWLLWNLADVVDYLLGRLASRTESRLDDQLVPLIRKTLRIFIVVMFGLFAADNIFEADISAWLAGLGIAGLAVSLAAQDSIKNVFGSVTILMDRPFQVGDLVQYGGQTGTVEEIGFRSTRIRTLAGSLLTVPNATITDSIVENLSARKSIRRTLDVTVTYDTPVDRIGEAVELIRGILTEPEIAAALDVNNPPRVFFDDLNSDSLNIKVNYWFVPADYWLFLEHAQRFNLRLMEAFAAADIEFAFPTQTLYLAQDPKRRFNFEQAPSARP